MSDIDALLGRYGVLIVFLNVLLTQLGVPLPAVPTMVVAGALAAALDRLPDTPAHTTL